MNSPFDLHAHSYYSDGTDAPAVLVEKAHAAGLKLFALTDHDTMEGVPEAVEAGRAHGIAVLPSMEIDVQFHVELHILGYGLDLAHSAVKRHMHEAAERRAWRNDEILKKLTAAGFDLAPYLEQSKGNGTRLHFARALYLGGYADSVRGAFDAYLKRGCVGYVDTERPSKKATIDLIHDAGGLAVLAHPRKLKADVPALVRELKGYGLDGIEVYYPLSSEGEISLFCSLARQYGLLVTTGSDHHGANRKNAELGSAWRDVSALQSTYALLKQRYLS